MIQTVLISIFAGLVAAELHMHRVKLHHYLRVLLMRRAPKVEAEILRDAVVTLYLEPWESKYCLRRIVRMLSPEVDDMLDLHPREAAAMVDESIAADIADELNEEASS